jgi:hypothetical protein
MLETEVIAHREPSKVPKASKVGRPKTPPPPPPPPPTIIVQPPEPTRTQMAMETARAIAKTNAENNFKRMQKDNLQQLKAQKEYTKLADEASKEQIVRNCLLLTRYKRAYEGTIEYKFRKSYDADRMTLLQTEQEIKAIREELNGKNIPFYVNHAIVAFAKACEFAALATGYDGLVGFTERVDLAIEGKEFDEEVKQLGVEFADYFMIGPGKRLTMKLCRKAFETMAAPKSVRGPGAPGDPNAVPAYANYVPDTIIQNAADL